jgi:hypothetical protein
MSLADSIVFTIGMLMCIGISIFTTRALLKEK